MKTKAAVLIALFAVQNTNQIKQKNQRNKLIQLKSKL
jgi:hypothetical protein